MGKSTGNPHATVLWVQENPPHSQPAVQWRWAWTAWRILLRELLGTIAGSLQVSLAKGM